MIQTALSEQRRAILLRVLADQSSLTLNEGVLEEVLERFGHVVSQDTVRTEAQWLAEQGLVTIERGALWVLTLTRRGADVVRGKASVPGVKRLDPAP